MKLIVGLGNPGKEYSKTRHNVGFMVIDNFASKNNLLFKSKFNGLYSEFNIRNEKIILLKPQNYMNLSGKVVYDFKKYFNIDNSDIFVIYDDINFEVGNFKIKKSGSSGGHNGIKDILNSLKTEEIKRLKIGISKNKNVLKDYVLGEFSKSELNDLSVVINLSYNIINDFISMDFERLMSKYNGIKNEE